MVCSENYIIYITFSLSIQPSTDTRSLPGLAIISNAAKNMRAQVSLQDSDLVSFGYKPRSGKAESYGGSVSIDVKLG